LKGAPRPGDLPHRISAGIGWTIVPILLLSCPVAWTAAAQGDAAAAVQKQFQERVADYLKLRESVQPKLKALKPTGSEEKIKNHEQELAHEIREARRDAHPGDIFSPEIAAEFRRLIRDGTHGVAGRVRESIQSAEPVRIELHVNGRYPDNVPLPSTPPTLLLNLPPLPKELDYRVIGHDLVLRDTDANLIVDYLTNAVP
jgi:hypothetical protein